MRGSCARKAFSDCDRTTIIFFVISLVTDSASGMSYINSNHPRKALLAQEQDGSRTYLFSACVSSAETKFGTYAFVRVSCDLLVYPTG